MDTAEGQAPSSHLAQLQWLEEVKQRARAHRRGTSVPLLTFGLLTLAMVPFSVSVGSGPEGIEVKVGTNYFAALIWPAVFAFLALYYRRQEVRRGVGTGWGSYALMVLLPLALLLALFFVPTLLLSMYLSAMGLAAIGLLVMAILQRNWHLGVWAVVYGVVMTAENSFHLSFRLVDLVNRLGIYPPFFLEVRAGQILIGLLGLAMVAAGLAARRRELRAP